jgi:S-formylglutathione hydrolase
MEIISVSRCFGGSIGYYRHDASTTRCSMRFTVFIPPQADKHPVPVLWWLSGLTCTEDNFTVKAGAYRKAAESGLMIVAPDTSPRGKDIPDDEADDLGQGAGFYVDATNPPWSEHFNMYRYITAELPELVFAEFSGKAGAQGIFGHSMGGHGALMIGLRNPERFRSISAFAPIVAPTQCSWGQKAFSAYLGDDRSTWREYDATELMANGGDGCARPGILIDQGLDDNFLSAQLLPDKFAAACAAVNQRLELRKHAGYDHSYFFVASFIDDHIQHHADILMA